MESKKIIVAILFFIGSLILIDTLIMIIRIEIEQDVQEDVLRQSLQRNVPIVNKTIDKKNSDNIQLNVSNIKNPYLHNIIYKIKNIFGIGLKKIQNKSIQNKNIPSLNSGNIYTNNNQDLWKLLNKVDNTKVGEYRKCNYFNEDIAKEINGTVFHGDEMMDVYRNDLMYKYDMNDKITNIEDIDPYDPEIYASYQNKKNKNIIPKKQSKFINDSLINHTHVSKDVLQNPTQLKYPILSDTHYAPIKVKKYNYVPPVVHCDIHPSINKTISNNLISDNLLTERTGTNKVMTTNTISNELISLDDINYDVKELVPQFNPLDNHLYKIKEREPVQSMVFHSTDSVCGYDGRLSDFAEIENNDLKETTGA